MSGSWPWKICLLLDETAHAQPVQFLLRREEISRGSYCDLRCIRKRIAICAATARRESNCLDSLFNRELQRAPITIRQGLRLVALSSSPNGADCVNDKTR